MMLEILGVGFGAPEQAAALQAQPAFRKATRNMALGFSAANAALAGVNRELLVDNPSKLGLVLGTCFGELDTTREFLDGFYENGLARPVLFQNSLHNATTGFIAIQLKLSGPSFTVSRGGSSGLAALELAAQLCLAGLCQVCLVLSVEARVAELELLFREQAVVGEASVQVRQANDGASALLLAVEGTAERLGQRPRALLEDFELIAKTEQGVQAADAEPGGYFEAPLAACPVTLLARGIAESAASHGRVSLSRVKGAETYVTWRRS